jgi:hypothetical protein
MYDLFACHVVGWRRIPSNQVGGKLFPKNKASGPNIIVYYLQRKKRVGTN